MANLFKAGLEKIATTAGRRIQQQSNADSARLHDPINGAAVQPTNLMTLSPSTTPAK